MFADKVLVGVAAVCMFLLLHGMVIDAAERRANKESKEKEKQSRPAPKRGGQEAEDIEKTLEDARSFKLFGGKAGMKSFQRDIEKKLKAEPSEKELARFIEKRMLAIAPDLKKSNARKIKKAAGKTSSLLINQKMQKIAKSKSRAKAFLTKIA